MNVTIFWDPYEINNTYYSPTNEGDKITRAELSTGSEPSQSTHERTRTVARAEQADGQEMFVLLQS